MTVTRFTPQAMKHDRLASAPGTRPWQWVPWLPWCRWHRPRLRVPGEATSETSDVFRDIDQRESVDTDWDGLGICIGIAL